jgi:hypothetical protein
MKSMKTLLRVKQREIDALKRQQGILEKNREDLEKTITMLADRLRDELKAAQTMPELSQFFGDFSSHIKKRQEQIHAQVRKVEAELDKIAEQVREKFSEMKKYELALAAFDKREADKRRRLEQQAMDEMGLRGYIRRDVS